MTKEKTPKSLTRKELYDLVWKKPAMQIAKEYGLSDRGIGKLCERHGIPTPPRGYWAQIASGQKIKKPPLLSPDKDGEGEKILEQRIKTALSNSEVDQEEVLSKEIKEIIEFENNPKNKIKVPSKLTEYHKVIKKDQYNRQKWDNKPLSGKDKRRSRILTALLYALESRGYYIFYLDNIYRLKVQNSMESVDIGIHDYVNRYKRDLTDEELAKNPGGRKWTYVDEKTNLFVLCIYNAYGRLVKNVIETDENKLENQLNKVVIEITKEILDQRSYRLAREEAEHKRYLEQEKIRKEKEKRENLIKEADNWIKANNIRAYVQDVIANRSKKSSEEINKWSEWALQYANELDPTK